MRTKGLSKLAGLGLVFLFLPAMIDLWFLYKDIYYEITVRQYECMESGCKADFNGDGTLGQLVYDSTTPAPKDEINGDQQWLVVTDNGQEALRLPYRYVDNTLRTHAAIHNQLGIARLLIYDRVSTEFPIPNGVFSWNGSRMVPASPTDKEKSILSALAARDDTGSWNNWVIYRILRLPIIIIYYLPLIIIVRRLLKREEFRGMSKKLP